MGRPVDKFFCGERTFILALSFMITGSAGVRYEYHRGLWKEVDKRVFIEEKFMRGIGILMLVLSILDMAFELLLTPHIPITLGESNIQRRKYAQVFIVNYQNYLEGDPGIEPGTFGSGDQRSIH